MHTGVRVFPGRILQRESELREGSGGRLRGPHGLRWGVDFILRGRGVG